MPTANHWLKTLKHRLNYLTLTNNRRPSQSEADSMVADQKSSMQVTCLFPQRVGIVKTLICGCMSSRLVWHIIWVHIVAVLMLKNLCKKLLKYKPYDNELTRPQNHYKQSKKVHNHSLISTNDNFRNNNLYTPCPEKKMPQFFCITLTNVDTVS